MSVVSKASNQNCSFAQTGVIMGALASCLFRLLALPLPPNAPRQTLQCIDTMLTAVWNHGAVNKWLVICAAGCARPELHD